MTPRPQFDAGYIEAELQELGAALNTEVTAFLIGGRGDGVPRTEGYDQGHRLGRHDRGGVLWDRRPH